MFVQQGARQFEIWSGKPAPIAEMSFVVTKALERLGLAQVEEEPPAPKVQPRDEEKPAPKPPARPAAKIPGKKATKSAPPKPRKPAKKAAKKPVKR